MKIDNTTLIIAAGIAAFLIMSQSGAAQTNIIFDDDSGGGGGSGTPGGGGGGPSTMLLNQSNLTELLPGWTPAPSVVDETLPFWMPGAGQGCLYVVPGPVEVGPGFPRTLPNGQTIQMPDNTVPGPYQCVFGQPAVIVNLHGIDYPVYEGNFISGMMLSPGDTEPHKHRMIEINGHYWNPGNPPFYPGLYEISTSHTPGLQAQDYTEPAGGGWLPGKLRGKRYFVPVHWAQYFAKESDLNDPNRITEPFFMGWAEGITAITNYFISEGIPV